MLLHGKNYPADFKKRFFIGMHMTDLDQNSEIKDILKDADPRLMIKQLADSGCDLVYFYMSCHMGNCYYQSKIPHARVHSAMKDRDFLAEACEAAQEYEVALVAVYEFRNLDFHDRHERVPDDWVHKTTKDGKRVPSEPGMCFNGGYGDFVMAQIKEVAENYPVAGFYIDMLDYPGLEMCPACIEKFRADTENSEYPDANTPKDSALFKEYKMWTYRSAAEYLNNVRAEVHKFIPGATVVNNFHFAVCDDVYQIRKAVDYVTTDPGINVRGNKMPVMLRALNEDRQSQYVYDILLDDIIFGLYQIAPYEQYMASGANILAQGGTICTDGMWQVDGSINPMSLGLSKEVYKHIEKSSPWIAKGEKYLKFAGVYYSQETESLRYNLGDKSDFAFSDYYSSFMGALIMLEEAHFPVDVLTRLQLCRLDEYNVIFLPNCACLSEFEVNALKKYVESGGTLVSSYRTSLADEWGNMLENFQLAEVFGVDYDNRKIEHYQAVQLKVDRDDFPFEPWENDWMTVNEDAIGVLKHKKATQIASLHDRYRPSNKPEELFAIKNAFVKEQSSGAGIVENKYGEGRSIYISARAFCAYAKAKTPELKKMITCWLLKDELKQSPVMLETMPCIKLSGFERGEEAKWIIHLTNGQVNPGESYNNKSSGIPNAFVTVESILPVHDVKIILNVADNEIKRLYLPFSDHSCRVSKRDDGKYEAIIPKVHLHEIIEIEFCKKWERRKERFTSDDMLEMIKCPYKGNNLTVEEVMNIHDGWNGMGEGQD